MSKVQYPTVDDIADASDRIAAYAVETPLLEFAALNELLDGRVLLKAENLQRTGSFKFRGAYNKLAQHDPDAFPGGIVASSSGNHAQGVAEAARLLGYRATIVMPMDAPAIKVERTRASGAEVVPYDRAKEDRIGIALGLAAEREAEFVHPFDDFDIVCGQGTCGLEITEQALVLGAEIDQVLVCCAGGGLTSGVATAIADRFPGAAVHPVEPAGFDDFRVSLETGELRENAVRSGSICDALLTPHPGKLPFAIGQELMDRGLVITDEEALAAVRFAFRELKLVLEPGGAAALAAALHRKVDTAGRTTVCVLSGGNVTPDVFNRALQA